MLRAGDHRSELIVFIVSLSNLPLAWDVIDYAYQARIDARPIVIARNVSFAVSAAVRVALVLAGAQLLWFAWVISGEAALAAILMTLRSRAGGMHVTVRAATWQEARRLAVTSWPLVIAGLSVSIYMRVDQVMLGKLMGDVGVGLFSAAVRVSEALYFLPVAAAASVAPALTALHARSTCEYERRFRQLNRLLVWAALTVAGTFAVFSRPIIVTLYGPQYLQSAAVLAIHAWAGVLVSLGVCGSLWLTNAGLFRFSMYQTLAGAVVNVLLNLALIPRYGVIGAALATCAAQLASTVIALAVLPATRQLLRLQFAAVIPRGSA